jgi:hypothetical protein
MNITRIALLTASLVLGVSAAGCSDDDGQSSSSGSPAPSGSTTSGQQPAPSPSTSSSSSTEQECRSTAINGRCYEGPNKGKSCCMTGIDDENTCAAGTDCDTVCRYCK